MHDADTHAPSPAARELDASLAAALADVHMAIARAADEVDLMAALAGVLDRRAPARCELCLFSHDEHGAPATIAITVVRASGTTTRDATRATPVSAAPLASLWLAAPNDALEIPDLDADPRVSAGDRQALTAYRAVTILPLHSHRQRSWQGYIRLLWTAPRRSGAADHFVDRVLMQTVAAAIASRRTLRAHEAAIAETQALQAAQARLHAAASQAELLAVVAEIAATHDASAAWLARVDPDDHGAPAWLEILATWGDAAV
ncbi:MAG TPA: hypothetical protein VGB85_34335, partial [Nannocystis sp.]